MNTNTHLNKLVIVTSLETSEPGPSPNKKYPNEQKNKTSTMSKWMVVFIKMRKMAV